MFGGLDITESFHPNSSGRWTSKKYLLYTYSDYNERLYTDLSAFGCVETISEDPAIVANRLANALVGHAPQIIPGGLLELLLGSGTHGFNGVDVLVVHEMNRLARNPKLLQAVRNSYPHLKTVLLITNIIGSRKGSINWWSMVCENRSLWDLIFTFDFDDAKRYGLHHYEGCYSMPDSDVLALTAEPPSFDIYWAGLDKGRLGTLLEAYDYFKAHGLRCRFDVVSADKKVPREGIFYHDRPLPYAETINHAARAKALLEVMAVPDHPGTSLRLFEAISLGKLLVTNNSFLLNRDWYDSAQILVFDNVSSIDCQSVQHGCMDPSLRNDMFSPVQLFEQIDFLFEDGKASRG